MTDKSIAEALSAAVSPLLKEALSKAAEEALLDDAVWAVVEKALAETYIRGRPYLMFLGGKPEIGVQIDDTGLNCGGPVDIYSNLADDYDAEERGGISPGQFEEAQETAKGMTELINLLTIERDKLLALRLA